VRDTFARLATRDSPLDGIMLERLHEKGSQILRQVFTGYSNAFGKMGALDKSKKEGNNE
jgi:hypothetical protein